MADSRSTGGLDDGTADGAAAAARTHESSLGGDAGSDDDNLLIRGTTLGRYVVLERLGSGAMGVVYAAYDPELDRKVALKLLRSRSAQNSPRQTRLQREAQAIAKLSHPNVVGIFDVGVYEGQVFLAMEHLQGGTLSEWLAAKKRPWQEILQIFVEIGRGLSAAHAEGLVHRDFKPDNVLLDKDGKAKVVDFGLVRLSSALGESMSPEGTAKPTGPANAESSQSWAAFAADLTRTGAMTGTPAYMAPEQFLGHAVTASSDQFAYCVALYKALYGAPPFSGETVLKLAMSVTEHTLNAPPSGATAPLWVRRVIEQGLELKPEARFATMAEVVRRLDRKPITLKRVGVVGGLALTVAAVLVVVTSIVGGRQRARAQLQATIGRNLDEARRHADAARKSRAVAEAAQAEAARLFDEGSGLLPGGPTQQSWSQAETVWARSVEADTAAQSEYVQEGASLEAALFVDPRRSDVRDQLIRSIDSRRTLAESMFHLDLEAELAGRLRGLFGTFGQSAVLPREEARISLTRRAQGLRMSLAKYVPDAVAKRVRLDSARDVGGSVVVMAPGSYLLTFSRDGQHVVRLPILLRRGQEMTIDPQEPRWSAVPEGFVFIHAGQSLIGSNEENVRSALDVPPMHALTQKSFLIGRFEVTFAEYIRWLDTLPSLERARRTPANRSDPRAIELRFRAGRGWTLALQASAHRRYVADWGEPIRYVGRPEHAVQDWRRFPVTGISFEDAQGYAGWLANTARVPGAHVCRDEEWERAARGADGRLYAHGGQISPSEANMALTYRRIDDVSGPDEVGTHRDSASPFAVEDMEGNAGEMIAGARWNEITAFRGGSWFEPLVGQRLDTRFLSEASFRFPGLGFRICATAPVEQ
jgi:formylglycine-generating enzyme required for sulfatase activity